VNDVKNNRFYQMPKFLFEGEFKDKLNNDARVLYSLLRDRHLFGSLTADAFSSSEPASILTYLMTITVFALTLFKSGTWAKQIVGIT
jgi:hypothetical protein